jgi:mannose-6-phosphate isomerase-like protein (cupin superfamily)
MHKQFSMLLLVAVMAMGGNAMGQNQSAAGPQASVADAFAVKYYSKTDLAASFAKGGTIADGGNYKVMTAHRTDAGPVEVHRNFTDVFYIVQGSTTLVTGGKVIDENDKNPDEPRGTAIEGGDTRKMSAGDAVVIPAGVPHWMKDVEGTLLYFVVKVEKAK